MAQPPDHRKSDAANSLEYLYNLYEARIADYKENPPPQLKDLIDIEMQRLGYEHDHVQHKLSSPDLWTIRVMK